MENVVTNLLVNVVSRYYIRTLKIEVHKLFECEIYFQRIFSLSFDFFESRPSGFTRLPGCLYIILQHNNNNNILPQVLYTWRKRNQLKFIDV